MSSVENSSIPLAKSGYYHSILPFFILGIMCNSTRYLNLVFNLNLRWLLIVFLMLYLLVRRTISRRLDILFFIAISSYVTWCVFTSFWSDVFILSFSKSILNVVILITMVRAGIAWVRTHSWDNSLDYLWMFAYFTFIIGFLGPQRMWSLQPQEYYSGLAIGSNMFGLMIASVAPYFLWYAYKEWGSVKKRLKWLFFISWLILFLKLTSSRTAIVMFLFILMGLVSSLKLKKKVYIFLMSLFIGLSIISLNPDLGAKIKSYIYKSSDTDLFFSRRTVWEQSYEGAMAGGLLGIGYGSSYQYKNFSFEHGLSSVLYGREKGNSQLAVMEETGVIGLLFYTVLMTVMSLKVIFLWLRVQDRQAKVLVGLIAGNFFGLFLCSCFEAWWTAPSSPDSICFWLLVGIIRGLEMMLPFYRVKHV